MENAAVKLNSGFTMRPYSMFHAGKTRAELAIQGQIYSMTQKENVCRWGYATICNKLHVAKSTVAAAIRRACDKGFFSRERRGGKTSEYTYTGDTMERGHIRTENFFYTEKAVFPDGERFLKLSEVDVLSLIYTHTRAKTGKFEGSTRIIAEILGVAERTVRYAVKALLEAELIYRSEKGVNHHVRSVFTANMKWIRRLERAHVREERRAKSALPKEVEDANARADRDRVYAARRQEAQAKADKCLLQARSDLRFVAVEAELRPYELKLAKAELYEPAKLPALLSEYKALKTRRKVILQELGLSERMLCVENYCVCVKCNDTGHLPNGSACDCYTLRT